MVIERNEVNEEIVVENIPANIIIEQFAQVTEPDINERTIEVFAENTSAEFGADPEVEVDRVANPEGPVKNERKIYNTAREELELFLNDEDLLYDVSAATASQSDSSNVNNDDDDEQTFDESIDTIVVAEEIASGGIETPVRTISTIDLNGNIDVQLNEKTLMCQSRCQLAMHRMKERLIQMQSQKSLPVESKCQMTMLRMINQFILVVMEKLWLHSAKVMMKWK